VIRHRLVDNLDTMLSCALVAACGGLYFAIGWWTLALVPAYCAGALAMGAYARMTDFSRYAPAELQQTADGSRKVRLCDEPMPFDEVLPWLLEQGLVKRVEAICLDPECRHEHCEPYELTGWGTTYFAVPFDKTEPR
jgi:hypothetical protein